MHNMNMLLISTCGTSLLTNSASEADRKWLTTIANDIDVDTVRFASIVDERRTRLRAAKEPTRRAMSAELNGIGAVIDRHKPSKLFHLLVHTDTTPGKATADLVQEALGDQTALMTAAGLRTKDLASFRAALADLTKELDALVRDYRARGWTVVFNLTGGFKSLNGYLQTLAMISADRCVFLFEGAPELMEIPRLPVRLAEADELRTHAGLFRRMAVGYTVKTEDVKGAPDSLLMENDGEVTTSVLGDVAWGRHRATLFAETLLPPLSDKVRVADAVRRAFGDLEGVKRVEVNEAFDEFSAHIDHGRPLPKSRTFKPLRGDPVPGSTHELYAWSDGAAGRLFGHFVDGGVFVFDRLESHLR